MKLFEYIFYRIAKFYYKRDGSRAFGAVAVVSVMQGVLFADIMIVVLNLFVENATRSEYVKYGRPIGYLLAFSLIAFNYWYFKDTYWKLSDRWREKETSAQRRMRGYLVVLSIFTPFILLILLGIVL
jgi:hypothetical protein